MATAARMPTASRLIAGVFLLMASSMSYFVFEAQYPDLRLDRDKDMLMGLLALIGFVVGWFSLGRRIGTGAGSGVALGLRSAIAVAAWSVLAISMYRVIDQIVKGWLSGKEPMVAILRMFGFIAESAPLFLNTHVVIYILLTGVGVGLVTAGASRRWN